MYAYHSPSANYLEARALVDFELPEEIYQGSISEAKLHLYLSSTASTAYPIRVAAMGKDWGSSSTWNSLGTYQLYHATSVQNPGAGQFAVIDVKTIVEGWADYTLANHGFCVYVSESETGASHQFKTKEATSERPHLYVVYTPRVNVYWHDADGTDQDDDTEAFIEALEVAETCGGVVYVPPGYYFLRGLDITQSNIRSAARARPACSSLEKTQATRTTLSSP
jgi:hypothetical protein